MASPRRRFEKFCDRHVVVAQDNGQTLLYVDRHLAHEGSFHSFTKLRREGRKLRRPEQTFAVPDHYRPTRATTIAEVTDPELRQMIEQIGRASCRERVCQYV